MFKNLKQTTWRNVLFIAVLFMVGGAMTLTAQATNTLVGPFNNVGSYSLTTNGFAYAYEDPTNPNKSYVVVNGTSLGSFYGGTRVSLFEDGRYFFTYSDGSSKIFARTEQGSVEIFNSQLVLKNDSYAFVLKDSNCTGNGGNPITNACSIMYKKPGQAPVQETLKNLGLDDGYLFGAMSVSQQGLIFGVYASNDGNAADYYVYKNIGGTVSKYGPFYRLNNNSLNLGITASHYAFGYKKDQTVDVYFNYDGQESGPYAGGGYGTNVTDFADTIIIGNLSSSYNSNGKTFVNGTISDNTSCSANSVYSRNNSFFNYYSCYSTNTTKYYFNNIWDGLSDADNYYGVYGHLFTARFNKSPQSSGDQGQSSTAILYKDGNCVQFENNYNPQLSAYKVNGVVQDTGAQYGNAGNIAITGNSWAYTYTKNNGVYIRYGINETNPTGAGCDYTIVTSTCGNGQVESGEVCDGTNLNNQTCSTQGFTGGTLSCASNCQSFVTSACTSINNTCGNGTIDAGEVCDGTNLNSQTCSTRGFSSGTLSCASNCQSFVTSGCTNTTTGTCTDTDGGSNFTQYGTATLKDVGGNILDSKSDVCSGTYLTEYYCQSNQILNSTTNCAYGCESGACKQNPNVVATCTDTDDKNINNKGSVTGKDTSGNDYTTYDECNGAGTQVNEMWCYDLGTGKVAGKMVFNCPYGCSDGACKQNATVVATCTDSDDKDIYNKGFVTGKNSSGVSYTTYDDCNGAGTQVNEKWCYDFAGGKVVGTMVFNCPNSCVDGACKQNTTTPSGKWIKRTSAGNRYWKSISSSSDGTKLAAVVETIGYIYTSTDSGATWTDRTSAGHRDWFKIASSADGTKLVAVVYNGYIYTSTDSGATWTERTSAGSRSWHGIASSADGTKLAANNSFGYIYTSTDSGATWTEETSAGSHYWHSIASSADGNKLVATTYNNGYIYTSTDSGATWTERTSSGSRNWGDVSSSADGTKLAVANYHGYIYTSTDSGATWTERTSAGNRNWEDIASSADGTKLAADNSLDYIYTSTDSGATWTEETSAGSLYWHGIASSADGNKLAAVSYGESSSYIWTRDNSATGGIASGGDINGSVTPSESGLNQGSENALTPAKITKNEDNTLTLQLNRLISALEQKVMALETRLTAVINKILTNRLKGQILIQPEANGEVWYTSPDTGERFYVANGQAAYGILSGMGKGITNKDLQKVAIGYDPNLYGGLKDSDQDGLPDVLEQAIGTDPTKVDTDGDGFNDLAEVIGGYNPNGPGMMPVDKAFAKKLKGIYLDVNNRGAAWYINPKDFKRYYVSPETAYNVMKFLSLGISNSDLRQVPVGQVSQ